MVRYFFHLDVHVLELNFSNKDHGAESDEDDGCGSKDDGAGLVL